MQLNDVFSLKCILSEYFERFIPLIPFKRSTIKEMFPGLIKVDGMVEIQHFLYAVFGNYYRVFDNNYWYIGMRRHETKKTNCSMSKTGKKKTLL